MAATPPPVGNNVGNNEAPAPLPVWQYLVGDSHSLRVQAEEGRAANNDGKGHADSWGVGWMDSRGETSLIRQTGSAFGSAYFVFASESAARGGAGSGPGRVVIGHLRKASCGEITSENAHPIRVDFVGANGPDTLLVAHNGTVRKPLLDALRADLETTARLEKASDSDTVVLAGWLGAQLEASTDPDASLFDTLARALQTLFEKAVAVAPNADVKKAYSSICLLVAHRSGLFALRQFSKEPDYYTLFAAPLTPKGERNESGGWAVSSEPTTGGGSEGSTDNANWTLLEPGVFTFYPASGVGDIQTATVAPPFAG